VGAPRRGDKAASTIPAAARNHVINRGQREALMVKVAMDHAILPLATATTMLGLVGCADEADDDHASGPGG